MPRSERINEEALRLMRHAEHGISETLDLVVKFRALAIAAANEGVNDRDSLAAIQAELDNGLDTIDRIAKSSQEPPASTKSDSHFVGV